jgi:very-short-patch-repair endonuclease
MNVDDYFQKTKKRPHKTKPRSKFLPKAKEKYLEAEEALFQELEEHLIGFERRFQFESTKNWRFDFHIVKLRLLIEIAGSPWSDGRGGKKIANAYCKYNVAEEMGLKSSWRTVKLFDLSWV